MAIRAGQQDPYQQQSYYANDGGNSQSYEGGFANYNPPPTGYDEQAEASMMQESVQDRHNKWRQEQMEKYVLKNCAESIRAFVLGGLRGEPAPSPLPAGGNPT